MTGKISLPVEPLMMLYDFLWKTKTKMVWYIMFIHRLVLCIYSFIQSKKISCYGHCFQSVVLHFFLFFHVDVNFLPFFPFNVIIFLSKAILHHSYIYIYCFFPVYCVLTHVFLGFLFYLYNLKNTDHVKFWRLMGLCINCWWRRRKPMTWM